MNTATIQSNSRRNTLIRTVTALVGDIATGAAIAAACVWLIESAMLGLFLSFLIWLIGALLALAISQYVVHPTIAVLMSDRKLDDTVSLLSGAMDALATGSNDIGQGLWAAALDQCAAVTGVFKRQSKH